MIISCREAQISPNVYKLDKRQCFLRITERTNCLINVRSLPWSAISIKKFFKNTLITDAAEQHLHSPIYRQAKGFLSSHWKQSHLTVFLRPKWSRLVQFNSQAKLDLIWFSFKSRLDQRLQRVRTNQFNVCASIQRLHLCTSIFLQSMLALSISLFFSWHPESFN